MRIVLAIAILLLANYSYGQDAWATANKCYQDKNYQCAADNYKKVLVEKKYNEKDYATILYRIGYSLDNLEKFDEAEVKYKEAIAAKPDYGYPYWDLASLYYELGKYEQAAEYYGKAAELYKNEPKSEAKLYYWKGKSYASLLKNADAITAYKLAIKTDSTVGNYYAGAADANYNLGYYNDAATYYQRSIQLGDNDKKIMSSRYYWLGQSYFQLKKFNDALSAYNGSLEYNAENKNSAWGIAAVYYNLENWPEAANHYTRTMTFYKDDTTGLKDLYYYRGRCYFNTKDYTKALADFDALIKISPNYRDAYWQKGTIYREQKKYKEAISFYDKAIELYKGVNSSLDDLHYFRGLCYLQLKDTSKGESDFSESLKINSTLRDANVAMGHISFGRKKYYEAKDYYSKGADGLKADSAELSRVYYRKGFSNYILGNIYFNTAKDDFQKSIRYDTTNRESRRWLADIYYSQQLFYLTEKEMDKCIILYKTVKDSLPKMYLYRGLARFQQKKYKDALEDFEKSDQLQKITDAGYVRTMAQISFELPDYPKTITYFTRLIPLYKPEQKTDLAFAYYGRGRAYHQQKNKVKAKADLEKAVELVPTYTEAKTWLETVNRNN